MGFSITRFLTGLAGSAVSAIPIIGPLLTATASGFGSPRQTSFPTTTFPARTSSQVGPTILGGGGPRTLPGAGGVLSLAMGAGRLIASLLARASATLGKRITRAGVLSLTREVGIVAAATALGLTAVEIAQIIASKPKRRRRGITAAQLTTTKATIRRMDSINRAIAQVCPPAARRRSRSRATIHHAK